MVSVLFASSRPPFTPSVVPRLDVEVTRSCNHRCAHCYNVWNVHATSPDSPLGNESSHHHSPSYSTSSQEAPPLATHAFLSAMDKAVTGSDARQITITGGEPFLRPDILTLLERACSLVPSVQVITNGHYLSPEMVGRLRPLGLKSIQLTLLSHRREQHDVLKGVPSFDQTLRAILDLQDVGIPVQACFVALKPNAGDFSGVLELCGALGIRSLSYNRMSAAGGAAADVNRLLPSIVQVEHNLLTAERLGHHLGIRVSTAMPIPPCVIRTDHFRWVRMGYCIVGSGIPSATLDPHGNVRTCNLSPRVLGNVLTGGWPGRALASATRSFARSLPIHCTPCIHKHTCKGGCKEAARSVFDDLRHPEPFVFQAMRSTADQPHDTSTPEEEPQP